MKTQYIEIGEMNNKLLLRKSLFWDVPAHALELEKNKRLILERVFSRGNVEEFISVNQYYTREEIRETVKRIGFLDKKTLNFISRTYHINPSELKCYKENL